MRQPSDSREIVRLALIVPVAILAIWLIFRATLPLVQPPFVGTWVQSSGPAWFLRRDRDGSVPTASDIRLVIDPGPEMGRGVITCVADSERGEHVRIPFAWRRGALRPYGRMLLHFEPDTHNRVLPTAWASRLPGRFGYQWSVNPDGRELTLAYSQGDSPQSETVTFRRAP